MIGMGTLSVAVVCSIHGLRVYSFTKKAIGYKIEDLQKYAKLIHFS